jgi:peptidoglycan/LPS O-acetylase OafA/YrhL
VPVVLYHYGFGMPGGFVGVDVFFVISGFLITSLLLRDIDTGVFSIAAFYERRARRILPALFLMVPVVTALTLIVFLPVDLVSYGRSLVAATLFVSNVSFWREFGYFDRAAEVKPLLHTWSLSVEEQFYVVFPLFLWLVARIARRRTVAVLATCGCASFVLCVVMTPRSPAAAFYLPIGRAWELLLGALLAAGAVPQLARRLWRDVASIAGILLIAGSTLLINRTVFPGWVAAAPCLGAALVILASLSGGGLGNRVLRWKPFVAVGLVSYSLYLWHWPLLVMAKYAANRNLTVIETLVVLASACLISAASWRWIEGPFRGSGAVLTRRRVLVLAAAGNALALACGVGLMSAHGFPSRLPAHVRQDAQVASEELSGMPACFGASASADEVRDGRLCAIGAPGASPSFLVWGDSHARRTSAPLAQLAREKNRAGFLVALGSCPPLLDVQWPVTGCRELSDEVVKLVERRRIQRVVLSALWARYAEGTAFKQALGESGSHPLLDELSVRQSIDDNGIVFARALRRTVRRLTAAGTHVLIVGPVPEIGSAVPETLAKAEWFGGTKDIGPSVAEFRERQRNVFALLDELASLPNVDVVYPSSLSCADRCEVLHDGRILYIDDNHLSRAGLDLMKPLLDRAFGAPGPVSASPLAVTRHMGLQVSANTAVTIETNSR